MIKPSTIAIDGPAGSGKSTLGELLARRLGYLYFDTGVMYRTVAWLTLQEGVDPADREAMAQIARTVRIKVTHPTVADGRQYTVLADEQDATWQIVSSQVDAVVSVVSAYPEVREALIEQQRAIARAGGVVMVGRDIGTVVVPDADLKIYLEASPAIRARRRYEQALQRGEKVSYATVLADLCRRDKLDSERSIAPLQPAADAVIIRSDDLSLEEEWQIVEKLIAEPFGSELQR
ncbi:MAG: (d)CMP kinase [Chloroflexi bacterium]|nr:(d)CMP kinase [Chloroflexota bacterium]MCL5074703.1 (d)CMP kinase [Chloroflexota bacterium]